MEIKILGYCGKFRHILFLTGGMRGYEIGYKLLFQTGFTVYAVEYPLELPELVKSGFAHAFEHAVRGVFGSDL